MLESGQFAGGWDRVGEVLWGHEPHCQEIKDTQIKSEFIFANRGEFLNI